MQVKKNYLLVIAVCFVITYIVIRSYSVDFTHDEAYSFHNVKHFWYAESFCTANTHWLNSIAMKAASLLNLENNWQLRWFSTVSAFVFFFICFLWICSLDNIYHKVFACSVLLLSPYVIDYFGLARGYASGLMLEGLSLCFFIINFKRNKRLFSFLSLLCAALSAIANYSFVYFFSAFAMVYFYVYYLRPKTALIKNKAFYTDIALCLAISAFIVKAWIFIMRCSQDLGAGTDKITDVSLSFLADFFYQRIYLSGPLLLMTTCGLVTLLLIICTYGVFMYKKHKQDLYFYTALMLSLILFILSVNFFCFKIVLPYARSALFLFPLISICIIYFMNEVFRFKLKSVLFLLFSILLSINFFRTISLSHTFDFYQQEETRNVFNYVDSIKAKHVAMNWQTFGVYRNYYQMTNKLKYKFKGEFMNNNADVSDYDYLLLSPPYNLIPFNHSNVSVDTVLHFPKNNIVLLKVKAL